MAFVCPFILLLLLIMCYTIAFVCCCHVVGYLMCTTQFIRNQKKNPIGCGLGAKFGSNYVPYFKKSKKQAISLGFFSYFWQYLLKQKVVIVKPPEWKFMAITARNAKF